MNWLSVNDAAAACDFRSARKCFSFSGSLLLMVLLLVAQTSCRPSDEKANDNYQVGDEYADVDNVEWHHVKIVDGVMHEDRPVIMYKEDFVNEDFVPNKNDGGSTSKLETTKRKYKDIAQHRRRVRPVNQTLENEKYNALKPEKIYFDVLPAQPVIGSDDSSSNDSNFDTKNIRVEVIPLVEDNEQKSVTDKKTSEDADATKDKQNKYPKKYAHSRKRRDVQDQHVVYKRNPYLVFPYSLNTYSNFITNQQPIQHRRQEYAFITYVVPGKKFNGLDLPVPPAPELDPIEFDNRFGSEFETDRVVWGSRRVTNRDRPGRPSRPSRPLRPQENSQESRPSRPHEPRPTRRPLPPIEHDSDPNQADFSFATQRPPAQELETTIRASNSQPDKSSTNDNSVSKCVWAIVNCCSDRDFEIRYQCFEKIGCSGAFWDLNPCASRVRDNVIDLFTNKDDDY